MTQKFYKNGKLLNENDFSSFGEMIMNSDFWVEEDYLTKNEILKKYGSFLSEDQKNIINNNKTWEQKN